MILNNITVQFTTACFTALFLGISAGITHCYVYCAPVISTYIMGIGKNAIEGLKSYIVFSAGKIFMCSIIGFCAGYMEQTFIGRENNFYFGSVIFGITLILIGFLMLIRPVCVCKKSGNKKSWFISFLRYFAFKPATQLFVGGIASAIVPCPPMGAILLYSLKMSSTVSCGIMMALFSIGTTISPLVIISIAAGFFSGKLKTEVPEYRMMFQRISALILILLGVFYCY